MEKDITKPKKANTENDEYFYRDNETMRVEIESEEKDEESD